MQAEPTDQRWMDAALVLAGRGLGRVWPNPAVGCVLVKAGRVVGRGWTGDGGRPHAEAVALAQAGNAAKGATVYVTLEPCAHQGRTPPCTKALIEAGVARVVAALTDPDPRVAGQGFEQLRAAGIEVAVGCRAAQARDLNNGFFLRLAEGRPMLTLKLAASLDGRIATASGESRWITSPPARAHVHLLRARHDAVLIGGGTARADDPMLDVRDLGLEAAPVRVVLDSELRLPLTGRLATTARTQPLWLFHGPKAEPELCKRWTDLGAELFAVRGGLDLVAVMAELGERGLTRVLCEGGGTLAASLMAARLVDALVVHSAGIAVGADGVPAVGPLNLQKLRDAPAFRLVDQQRLGPDIATHWVRRDATDAPSP